MSEESWYLPILSPLLSGLIGVAVVYYFGLRQLAKQHRLGFLERQLSELYAPLAGLRQQIDAKSELRLKIFNAMEKTDRRFEATMLYHNKQFMEELIPTYRQMLALFTDRYHLADADTRAFYPAFLEFVEVWNIWLAESLSPDALKRLDHAEENVVPFYEHLEAKFQELQDEIARG